MSENTYQHDVVDGNNEPSANYSTLSLLLHWGVAIAVIFLFLFHERQWLKLHTSLGIILAIPLIFRVIHRLSHGFPRPHNQHPALNFLARLVMIALLLSILTVTISGILLPLFEGKPYNLFGFTAWAPPYKGNQAIYSLLEEIHDIAGHIIIPLFILHIVGFAKHFFWDQGGNKMRMLKPIKGGK